MRGAAQCGLAASNHLVDVEGLGDVVVGAQVQQVDLGAGRLPGRDDDHGHLAAFPDGSQHLVAALEGQHQVQQHQVRLFRVGQAHAVGAGEGLHHPHSPFAQDLGQQVTGLPVVLDDQHDGPGNLVHGPILPCTS